MTRKQRVTRAVYGVFVVLVAAFVVSSIWQVARALFGSPASEAEAAAAAKVEPDCAGAIARAIEAIEKARVTASMEPNGDAAKERYDRERRASTEAASTPPGGTAERACAADPRGPEALAALARLERAAEAHAVRDADELRPVRLAAQSFIRGQPR